MSHALYVDWYNDKPKIVYLVDLKNAFVKKYKLWSSDNTLYDIFQKSDKLLNRLDDIENIAIIDYKKFITYFRPLSKSSVYDVVCDEDNKLQQIINYYNNNMLFMDWQKIRALAVEVYYKLENRKIINCYKKTDITYSLDVFSGRSKTKGFNIQGKNEEFDIRHVDETKSVFLSFDWISADARICALMSQDDNLINSFEESDPYTFIVKALDNKIDRNLCKSEWNKSVNSLNYNSPLFNLFPQFREWLREQVHKLAKNSYTKSILGRKFYSDGSHKQNKRAINSIFQGSVVHCMQNVLYKIDQLTEGILTEQHDSMIVCCNQCDMSSKVRDISKIMLQPLLPYLDYKFPLRIGVGNSWNKYKYFKECK